MLTLCSSHVHVSRFHIMIVVLFYGILVSNIILTQGYVLASNNQPDDNDEERIVVQKLANIIRQREQTKLKNAERDLENDEALREETTLNKGAEEVEPPFTYHTQKPITPDNVPRLNERPMAVPPSDFRFFQNDFSVASKDGGPSTKEDPNSLLVMPKNYEKIIALSSGDLFAISENDEKGTEEKEIETNEEKEDALQRVKIDSQFMMNPPFIPYGGAQKSKSISIPMELASNDDRASTKEYSSDTFVMPKNYEKITVLSAGDSLTVSENDEKAAEKKKIETDKEKEDAIQKSKLYAHLMMNPSFIPYGGAHKSKSIPILTESSPNLLAIIYGTMCAVVAFTVLITISLYRRLREKLKDAEDVDYPAYGVTGPNKETTAPTGDRHLAHSAQMYHYQHQKQQMKAMEKSSDPALMRKRTESGSEDDDFAVYECPGLAPVTGEMEVKNPMFQEETDEVKSSTLSSKESKQKKNHSDENKK